jgi:hypothetical protein
LFEGVGDELQLRVGVGKFLFVARDDVCCARLYFGELLLEGGVLFREREGFLLVLVELLGSFLLILLLLVFEPFKNSLE